MTTELTRINSSSKTNTHTPVEKDPAAMRVDAAARGAFENIFKYLSHNESQENFIKNFVKLLLDEGEKRQGILDDQETARKTLQRDLLNEAYQEAHGLTRVKLNYVQSPYDTWPASTLSDLKKTTEREQKTENKPVEFCLTSSDDDE